MKNNILITFYLFIIFFSIESVSTGKEIVLRFEIMRFPYQTEKMRALRNTISSEDEILKKYENKMNFISFRCDNETKSEFKESLNPSIGKELYTLILMSDEDLYMLVKELTPCPSYPFFGGFSFSIFESIIKLAIQTNDVRLYREFLTKDNRLCASEMVSSILSSLKVNKTTFLKAFSMLSDSQKRIAIISTHDINESEDLDKYDDLFINQLDDGLKDAAHKYNELVNEWNMKGSAFIEEIKNEGSRLDN